MFNQDPNKPNDSNKEEKKPLFGGSLFGGNNNNQTGSLFGNAPPSGASGGLFGGNNSSPSLFQGISPNPGSGSSPSPGGLFSGGGKSGQPSLFSNQDAKKDNKVNPVPQNKSNTPQATPKAQQPLKSQQAPKASPSLFGGSGAGQSGGLFGSGKQQGGSLFGSSMFGKKDQPSQGVSQKKEEEVPKITPKETAPLFGGKSPSQPTSLFGNPSKNIPPGSLFPKKEDKIAQPSSKASEPETAKQNTQKSSFFAPQTKQPEKKEEKKEPTQASPSLFGNLDMTKSMFNKKPQQGSQPAKKPAISIPSFMTESKNVEKVQEKGNKSLFGSKDTPLPKELPKLNFSGAASSGGPPAPLFGIKPVPIDKKQDATPAGSLTVKKQITPTLNMLEPKNEVQFSFAKSSQEEKSDQNKASQTQKTQNAKPSPFGQTLFSKQTPEAPKYTPFAAPEAKSTNQEQLKESTGSNLPEFPPSNVDQRKRQFTYPENKEDPKKPESSVTTNPQTSKKDTEKAPVELRPMRQTHSVTVDEKSAPQQQAQRPTTEPSRSRQPQSYLSTVRPRPVASKNFIDFKTLREEESNHNFSTFFSQKKGDIIQSIKVYFSYRLEEYKPVEVASTLSEKDKFYKDFANLLMKELKVEVAHFDAMEGYIRKELTDQKYEEVIFKGDSFSPGYFSSNSIYWQDYKGNYLLNDNSSPQVRRLAQKLIQKWFDDKYSYLQFIFRYTELISPKEDLFSYLFKALLKQETTDRRPQAKNNVLSTLVKDYISVSSQKMIELLELYNSKVGRNYRLLTENSDKFIIETLPLIENISTDKDHVIKTYLRIVLTAMKINQPDKLSNQLARAIRETKSTALLPLRVIVSKIMQGKIDFTPCVQDLYQFVKGDQWTDWIEIYLQSTHRTGMITELLLDQPKKLVEAICSISGERLLDRLVGAKKGIYRFFELLREENQTNLYYRILETCLYNEDSIRQIDQFYFKKVNFSLEYQQIKEYVINFHENLNKENNLINQTNIFNSLASKISLLSKIIAIDPERIFQIQKYIFYPQFNPNKRLVSETGEVNVRQGHKLVHVLVDILKIIALKGLDHIIVPKILRALTALLKNRRTESIILTVTNISQPCLSSLNYQSFSTELWQALGLMLEQLLSCSYVEDLIIKDNSSTGTINYELFYPLRYNSTEFNKLLQSEQANLSETFSLKWLDQLFGLMARQPFDAALANRLLSKLHILPPESAPEPSSYVSYGIRRFSNAKRNVPKVIQMIVSLLNHYNIWQEISRVLSFKIHREEGLLTIINEHSHSSSHSGQSRILHNTLKLLSTVFRLSNVINENQQKSPGHFCIKALASVNVLTRVEIKSTINEDKNKNYLLLGLLSTIQSRQAVRNETNSSLILEAEEVEEDEGKNRKVLNFLQNNRNWLDFEQGSNFLRHPTNPYFQNEDNITSLALENIINYLKMCPNCCLEYSLQTVQGLNLPEKTKLKTDMVNKLKRVLSGYLSSANYSGIHHKIISFMVDLKHKVNNKLNAGLADALLLRALTIQGKNWDSKVHHILLKFMREQVSKNISQSNNFDRLVEGQVLDFVSNFQMKGSILSGNRTIADCHELTDMILKYHDKDYSLLNFNQLERIIEQKAIIDIGLQLQALANAIDIILLSLASRKYSPNLRKTLNLLNKLLAQKNLILIQNDIPFEYGHKRGDDSTLSDRLLRPRAFLRDPFEMFLSQGKGLDKKKDIQTYQKNNVIEWLLQVTEKVSQKMSSYLQVALTIDRTFYANNPLSSTTTRKDLAKKELFCHLSLGTTPFSAIEIFGSKQTQAVGVVSLIAQNLLDRVNFLHGMVNRASSTNNMEQNLYIEGVQLFGFCLEWLRYKKSSNNQPAGLQMARRVSQRYQCLLPCISNNILLRQQLKVLQSYLSLGAEIPNTIKYDIHHHLSTILERYIHIEQSASKAEHQEQLSSLLQQTVSVLLVCPPESSESALIDHIVRIWHTQQNDRYFFNEARLVLELASLYPDQLAKFNPLTNCKTIDQNALETRYANQERTVVSMSWLWGIKIASELASNSISVLAVEEAGKFFIKHKNKIWKILEGSQQRLSRAYLQDLQGVLELILALFSHNLWVTNNNNLIQEVTYLLSHHLIKLFVAIAQGKAALVPISKNELVLSQVRAGDQQHKWNEFGQNMMTVELKVRAVSCLRIYCLAMQRAFKVSQYDQKYFTNPVVGTSRYLTSFWDTFNKNITVLFNFSITRTEHWLKNSSLKSIIKMLNQCYQAPHTFYANGYLPTIIELPKNEKQLIEDHYLLTYLIGELGVVHYLKQKSYNALYNALMSGHTDNFGKRVREHLSKARELRSKIVLPEGVEVGEEHFRHLEKML